MKRINVLAVDDEHDFLKLLVRRLGKRNVDMAQASSGAQALQHLASHPVDVVLLDVKMPGMDGIETLKEIRKRHPEVEVVMLTGHGSVASGLEGMSLGAYDYVLKPFTIDDLLERILAAYERARLRKERGDA